MSEYSEKEVQESLDKAPEWLRNALEARRVAPGFRERCREAAMVAYGMAAMRKTREKAGLVPDTLDKYVNGLAMSAGVKLEPILRWLNIKTLDSPEPVNGRGYARLGKALGMEEADLVGHIIASLGVAEGVVFPLGRHGDNIMPISATAVIKQIESELSARAIEKLHLIRSAITKEYDSSY